MPSISKIRLTNIVYEDGNKRYNDEIFYFDGHNGAIILENGGGKTVFIHTVLQAIIPHTNLGNRKIKETLQLEDYPAHIGIEWIKKDKPRHYVTTCVSLFLTKDGIDSFRYVYEYGENDPNGLESIPFVRETANGNRPAERGEIMEYYSEMKRKSMYAESFSTIQAFRSYLEEHQQIIAKEWENIVHINGDEGGIDKFFENCRTTNDLYDRLLIPTVEGSLSGHEAGMFTQLFEKHREGFHMYKKLKESMEENRLIQEELEKYLGIFRDFSEKEAAYVEKKAYAKGLWQLLEEQKLSLEAEQMNHDQLLAALDEDMLNHKVKEASFRIFLAEERRKELDTTYKEQLALFSKAKDRLEQSEKEYASLELADFKQQLKGYEEELEQVKSELERQEKSEDLASLEDELEKTNRALKGYFLAEQEGLNTFITDKTLERQPLENSRDQLIKEEAQIAEAIRQGEISQGDLDGVIRTHWDRLNILRKLLLANPDQEDLAQEMIRWAKRVQELDEAIISLKQKEKKIETELLALAEERDLALDDKNACGRDLARAKTKEEALEEAQEGLLERLGGLKGKWLGLRDVYLQEHSISNELLDLHHRLNREQDTLLEKERIALRLFDNYRNQEMFFGDTFLQGQFELLENQLDYLVSGVEFFQGLNEDQKEAYASYPLWPMTLITTEQDKPKLLKHLQSIRSRMEIPVQVLTLDQVQTLNMDQLTHWVEPAYWENNLDARYFADWKEELSQEADQLKEKRQAKEEEISQLRLVRESFHNFFQKYSKVDRDSLKAERQELAKRLSGIERQIAEINGKMTTSKEESLKNREDLEAYQSEMNGLEGKLSQAQDYLQVEKQLQENEAKLLQVKAQLKELAKKQRTIVSQIKRFNEEIDYLNEDISSAEMKLAAIKQDRDYLAVKDYPGLVTGEELKVILDRKQSLDYELREVARSYQELKLKADYAKENIARINKEITRLKEDQDDIDETLIFPANGPALLKKLGQRINEQKEDARIFERQMRDAENVFSEQSGIVKERLTQFHKDFPQAELVLFQQTALEIEKDLRAEEGKLADRDAYLQQEKKRLDKELEQILAAIRELDRFQEAHHFNSSQIEAQTFSENKISDFTYKRLATAKSATSQLRASEKQVVDAQEKVDAGKVSFRSFCVKTIQDMKLQRMAIEGIEQKESYEDIVGFRNNMIQRLEQANKYAEDYISKNDKDLQAFIDRIHHHLQTVKEQLLIIPRKTMVRLESGPKNIFKFTIPDWTEEEGKERIREHIHWILEQLNSAHFLNDQGLEDHGKVRQALDKWLETKQLLQIVINHEKMKVNCRKVTNDNQVTSRFHTWEESNKWSGGEKWSKNMTLFLGLLNFVAEKKQPIESGGGRSRAVILDNPFGRASSDHVLSPVFFIAEQLGFQIIALTAHAEGKFIQNYFPIQYSCKLRSSVDPRKKVMTKEKSLHHAYFQDHDPDALERLGEVEQLGLF